MWGLDGPLYKRLLSARCLWVGFSGGLDSTVLLHRLLQDEVLKPKLHALHVHHALSQHADTWALHCRAVCEAANIPVTIKKVQLSHASNLEENARNLRFAAFEAMMQPSDVLLLGHHKDDQAETLLLNLMRGTGIDGLAAMRAQKPFAQGDLIRPHLNITRDALEAYANTHQLSYIEDESNSDIRFSRNYLRHEILPRLKAHWPGALDAITRCANHAKAASDLLNKQVYLDCEALKIPSTQLVLKSLYDLPQDALRQVLRVWLKQNGLKAPQAKRLEAIINTVIFSRQDSAAQVSLEDFYVRKYREVLYLLSKNPSNKPLRHEALHDRCDVRFRSGGERIRFCGHTRSLKYIFQTFGVPPWLRDTIPLVFIDNTLIAILDLVFADGYTKEDVYDAV